MKRGDIFDADLDPIRGSEQAGRRPVIIVSHDSINGGGTRVIVVPCTSYKGKHLYATNVFLQAGDGNLATDSVALCDQVRAISVQRLERQRGTLAIQSLARVDEALLIALGQL